MLRIRGGPTEEAVVGSRGRVDRRIAEVVGDVAQDEVEGLDVVPDVARDRLDEVLRGARGVRLRVKAPLPKRRRDDRHHRGRQEEAAQQDQVRPQRHAVWHGKRHFRRVGRLGPAG